MRRRPLSSRLTPPQVVALAFLGPGLLGGLLLATPLAQTQTVGVLDALFTGLSAVCLNGMATVDLRHFSGFGQTLILLLVQFGGLASLLIGSVLALTTGRRRGLGERLRLATRLGRREAGLLPLLRFVLLGSLLAEGLGTLLLWTRFGLHDGPGQGLFSALFHAVAAYNNSALSLYSQGLNHYATDPLVSLLIPLLSLLGGLSVLVQWALLTRWRERRTPLSTHVRLVLLGSAALLVLGVLGVAVLEWTNPATLGALPFGGKLLASLFQGVTPRSLGMHTVDLGALRPATWLLMTLLMFVGTAPASTGGGIKVSTFLVALGGVWQVLRSRADLVAFRRRIEEETVLRAAAVWLLALAVLGVGASLLLLLNPRLPAAGLLVETVSAFSSAGLSADLTASLSPGAKLVVMLLMALGRLLPFALLATLGGRPARGPLRYPPERDVLIG